MIGRSVVICEPKGRDRYKRVIAVCFKGEINLNAWMVAQGWAVTFRKNGSDYIGEEDGRALRSEGSGQAHSRCLGTGKREIAERQKSKRKNCHP